MTGGVGARGARTVLALLDGVLGTVVAALVLLTALQVGTRLLAGGGVPWVQEVTRLLFVWLVMIGAAVACARGAHIAFDALPRALPPRGAAALRALVLVAGLTFLAIVAWGGLELASRNTGQRSAVLGWPILIAYASIPVGAVLGIVGLLAGALRRPPAD